MLLAFWLIFTSQRPHVVKTPNLLKETIQEDTWPRLFNYGYLSSSIVLSKTP